ncbi:MAG: hypothetical protein DRQ02_08710 [Candidatus Latescibacterota bacterium]|nr:MoaD/ThiS family protein [Thermoplasmata archaeon]RKY66527.1 MAG: hypothetical protein DRQ02_08710 [Candidatus Latescibacterota bacterium]
MVRVRFYGKMRRIFGDEREMEGKTIEDILRVLEREREEVKNLREHLIFSINGREAKVSNAVNNEDEVAIFISPTGG